MVSMIDVFCYLFSDSLHRLCIRHDVILRRQTRYLYKLAAYLTVIFIAVHFFFADHPIWPEGLESRRKAPPQAVYQR